MLSNRRWTAIALTLLTVALVLSFLVYKPAPLNVVRARLVFTVETISLYPFVADGQQKTDFEATVRYSNQGPVGVELDLVLVAALSEEGGTLFDAMSDWSFSMENGEARTMLFDGTLGGSWETAVFRVKVGYHDVFRSYRITDVFSPGESLTLEV